MGSQSCFDCKYPVLMHKVNTTPLTVVTMQNKNKWPVMCGFMIGQLMIGWFIVCSYHFLYLPRKAYISFFI